MNNRDTTKNAENALTIRVLMKVEKDTDGSFLLTCPQIGCIFVQDETEEAVLKHGIEAIGAYIKMSAEHGDPIPTEIVESNPQQTSHTRIKKQVVPQELVELTRSFDYAAA